MLFRLSCLEVGGGDRDACRNSQLIAPNTR